MTPADLVASLAPERCPWCGVVTLDDRFWTRAANALRQGLLPPLAPGAHLTCPPFAPRLDAARDLAILVRDFARFLASLHRGDWSDARLHHACAVEHLPAVGVGAPRWLPPVRVRFERQRPDAAVDWSAGFDAPAELVRMLRASARVRVRTRDGQTLVLSVPRSRVSEVIP